ncbi:BrnT family toxin [Jiella sonneratiae]|uniref:BrnT family toxin n=1 Tax=Jiella sonneratiae TaxID=2816856 RepID=UPI003159EFE8
MATDVTFEWDDDKARSSLDKHGVDFIDAAQIFFGPIMQAIDDREDYGETRIRAVGAHDGQVYVVVYTMRRNAVRLISAWKAGRHDRKSYYESVTA